MKKLFFAIVAMIFCLNISAQGFGQMPQPEEIAKMQAENMKQNYGIDDKQYDAVYKLYLRDRDKDRGKNRRFHIVLWIEKSI